MKIRMHKAFGETSVKPKCKKLLLGFCLYFLAKCAKILYLGYHKTIKIQTVNDAVAPDRTFPTAATIYVFWHAKTFLILPRYRDFRISIFTLLNFKNLFYDQLCRLFGYQTVPVTSEMKATLLMRRLLEAGFHSAIALDGPKGPAGIIRPGALYLSQKTKIPIVAVKVECKKSFRLRSRWDHYEIPYPFSQVTVVCSRPMQVDKDNAAEVEEEIKEFLGHC